MDLEPLVVQSPGAVGEDMHLTLMGWPFRDSVEIWVMTRSLYLGDSDFELFPCDSS